MAAADRVADVLAALGDLGLVSLVKFDGEREHKRWTVVITGRPLADGGVRVDGNTLDYCLDRALAAARTKLPTIPQFDHP
ncbi:hypothetical protein GCM10009682_07990 [Luedemannella flava]|uniref:Uncharacterized protein n=1 Tax=Luedemannella flava TaxID=349316 RepID=A0ABN2LGV8_9ACTN